MNNSVKILFFFTLISGIIISLSANSWMSAWMGLEINLLSFISILSSNQNMYSNESALKYFLIQAIASSVFLFIMIMMINSKEMFYFTKNCSLNNLVMIPFLMKLGCAPFHWWLPSIIEGLTWLNTFIVLSIQKIAPMILIMNLINNNSFLLIIITITTFVGAIGGFNQISIRKILTYSSINHIGWMLTSLMTGLNLWLLYFTIYMMNMMMIIMLTSTLNMPFIINIFMLKNNKIINKIMLSLSMLSLGGLPPFFGFYPKWIIIQYLFMNNIYIILLMMIPSSLITLYFYIRLTYSSFMLSNYEMMWMNFSYSKSKFLKTIITMMFIIMMGMMMSNMFFIIY